MIMMKNDLTFVMSERKWLTLAINIIINCIANFLLAIIVFISIQRKVVYLKSPITLILNVKLLKQLLLINLLTYFDIGNMMTMGEG